MGYTLTNFDADALHVEVLARRDAAEAFNAEIATFLTEEVLVLSQGTAVCFLDGTRDQFIQLAQRIMHVSAP